MAKQSFVFRLFRFDPWMTGALLCMAVISVGSLAMITEHRQSKLAGGIAGAGSEQFDVSEYQVLDGKIVFDYFLPFQGVTRVTLKNSEGLKIWQSQYDNETGKNQIRLNSDKLVKGEKYTFTFEYKLQIVEKEVVIE